jgi:hypothetical protein
MSILTQIAALRAQVEQLFIDTKALLTKKLTRASVADNALAIQGKTQTYLTNTVNVVVSSHEANKSNPHQSTAAHLGMLNKAQIDTLLAPLMPQGQLAVSRYGSMDSIFPKVTATGWVVKFGDQVPVILTGQEGVMDLEEVNLSQLFASPASKTFYVYVALEAGALKYRFSETVLAETDVLMNVGTVVTGSASVSTITIRKVSRLMTQYRVYTNSNGSIEVVV